MSWHKLVAHPCICAQAALRSHPQVWVTGRIVFHLCDNAEVTAQTYHSLLLTSKNQCGTFQNT